MKPKTNTLNSVIQLLKALFGGWGRSDSHSSRLPIDDTHITEPSKFVVKGNWKA